MRHLRHIITFLSLTLPSAVLLAQIEIVPTGDGSCATGAPCNDWKQLFDLFQNILNWFIWISVPAATLIIAYAGWKMIWGSDKPGNHTEAVKMLQSALIGIFVVLAAVLIVKVILNFLVDAAAYPGIQDFIK